MNRRLARRVATLGVLAAACLQLTSPPATAHSDLATWYPSGWQERDIYYYFSGSSWGSIANIANRARDGANQWNMLNEGGFRFVDSGARTLDPSSCNNANENGVFWQGFDGVGGKVAVVYNCVYSTAPGRIFSSRVIFDGAEPNWYVGTGTPPSTSIDMWSVSTHEWGHAAGHSKHWDDGGQAALCPFSVYRESLCSSIPTGTTYMRSTEPHDEHTFGARY